MTAATRPSGGVAGPGSRPPLTRWRVEPFMGWHPFVYVCLAETPAGGRDNNGRRPQSIVDDGGDRAIRHDVPFFCCCVVVWSLLPAGAVPSRCLGVVASRRAESPSCARVL